MSALTRLRRDSRPSKDSRAITQTVLPNNFRAQAGTGTVFHYLVSFWSASLLHEAYQKDLSPENYSYIQRYFSIWILICIPLQVEVKSCFVHHTGMQVYTSMFLQGSTKDDISTPETENFMIFFQSYWIGCSAPKFAPCKPHNDPVTPLDYPWLQFVSLAWKRKFVCARSLSEVLWDLLWTPRVFIGKGRPDVICSGMQL